MINFFFENVDVFDIEDKTVSWLEDVIFKEGFKAGDINYIFCDDDYLLNLNTTYLNHDTLTDIITFDYVKGKNINADIFVSLPRLSENAKHFQISVNSEFHRVLVHGLLHLIGYADKTDAEILEMRSRENFHLARLALD